MDKVRTPAKMQCQWEAGKDGSSNGASHVATKSDDALVDVTD